jgi:hypothetical protein
MTDIEHAMTEEERPLARSFRVRGRLLTKGVLDTELFSTEEPGKMDERTSFDGTPLHDTSYVPFLHAVKSGKYFGDV